MFKIVHLIILTLLLLTFSLNVKAQDEYNNNVLKAGVSLIEQVPNSFFGVWRVNSTLIDTNSPSTFKKENVDLWNISREGSVINLSNPFSGAAASITLSYVNEKSVKFTRKGNYDGRILTDSVEINIEEDKFTGVNTLQLETLSDVDNSVIKTAEATYSLSGEKIAGMSILGK